MKHLLQFIEKQGLTIHKFEKTLEVRGSIDKAIKQNTNIGSNLLSKIIEIYPYINSDWLLTGKGEMLRNTENQPLQRVATPHVQDCCKELQHCKNENLLLKENIKLLNKLLEK